MDDQTKRLMSEIYCAVIAHRFLLQYLLAHVAVSTDDPVGHVREVIAATIVSMEDLSVLDEQPWVGPLLEIASGELELIGANIELRLSVLGGK